MRKNKPRIIAFYLPQYHPTPDNDRWWGKGFTEWTNVGKAKPLFKGHYQPHVPADLGYYDLRLPEVREAQAALAKEAGIEGFCYYHYWFGYGKQELELPFNEVLKTGKPDFPFCLCWANESWHSKFWNIDGSIQKKLLIEQTYGDKKEWEQHFYHILPAFQDKRYIRIDGKPLFMIYKEEEFAHVSDFIASWNDLAKKNGLEGIFFIANKCIDLNPEMVKRVLEKGFNAINTVGLNVAIDRRTFLRKCIDKLLYSYILRVPQAFKYAHMYPHFISDIDSYDDVFPSLIPNWDHTPRSGQAGYVLLDSTPQLFSKHIQQLFSIVNKKRENRQVVFLKSWNEWGEGNYMEPDLKFGKGYIQVLKNEIDNFIITSEINI